MPGPSWMEYLFTSKIMPVVKIVTFSAKMLATSEREGTEVGATCSPGALACPMGL